MYCFSSIMLASGLTAAQAGFLGVSLPPIFVHEPTDAEKELKDAVYTLAKSSKQWVNHYDVSLRSWQRESRRESVCNSLKYFVEADVKELKSDVESCLVDNKFSKSFLKARQAELRKAEVMVDNAVQKALAEYDRAFRDGKSNITPYHKKAPYDKKVQVFLAVKKHLEEAIELVELKRLKTAAGFS